MDSQSALLPNIAYLLLVGGFVLGMLAAFSPGTGLIELAALFLFAVAGYIIIKYDLPINWWALALLILGVFPFLIAVRIKKQKYLVVISIIALVIGSIFLFDAPGLSLAVNPWLALVVSTLVVLFFWIAATKTLQAEARPPVHNLSNLLGQTGQARTDIFEEGSIQVAGELWSARANQLIPEGTWVRVIDREGFILIVEALPPEASSGQSEITQNEP
jgi:membrane-bound ClpP family serine protease